MSRPPLVVAVLVALLTPSARADDLPIVPDVALQPLAAQARRIVEALPQNL